MPSDQSFRQKYARLLPVVATLGVVALALVVLGVARGGVFNQKVTSFTSLTVVRDSRDTIPPFRTTVYDADVIARLYAAALRLPVIPSPTPGNFIDCPKGSPVMFLLTFLNGNTVVVRMQLSLGCLPLLLIGNATSPREMTPAFTELMARTIGLANLFAPGP